MRNVLLIIIMIISRLSQAENNWPGAEPDCWPEPRMVHSIDSNKLFSTNVSISKSKNINLQKSTLSPNKGYKFSTLNDRPLGLIKIFAEKDYIVNLKFNDIFGLSNVHWINEKLIFARVWWGQIVATDFIFDVEKESVIYQESVTDSSIAFQQYKDACKANDQCKCPKNDNP